MTKCPFTPSLTNKQRNEKHDLSVQDPEKYICVRTFCLETVKINIL